MAGSLASTWRRLDGALLRGGVTVTALVFGLGWIGPLARPGYDLGLVLGLLAPSIVAVSVALDAFRETRAPLDALRRAWGYASLVALGATSVALGHGLREGFCDPLEGLTLFLLGPMTGLFVAGTWGLVARELAALVAQGRAVRRWLVALALLGPLSSIALGVGLFYATPAIFAYDPFVGFFSGALYDTVIPTSGLWAYRVGTAATLSAAGVAALHLERAPAGRLRLVWRRAPGVVTAGILAALVSVGSVIDGARLGHWQTARSLRTQLGDETLGDRCTVIHEPGLTAEAQLTVRECDAHVRELAVALGIANPGRITAYLFRDEVERRARMGAHHTSIAKPWRREIYLVVEEFPHPVLRHELAHVVAGEVARGPFRVAGRLGGWLPDPGLIEGLAESLAPRDDELSIDEWAATMRRLQLLPKLDRLFGLGFLTASSSASYTAAGSFVGFVRRTHGDEAVARWYGGATLEAVTGQGRDTLEQAWWRELDALPLREAALAEAKLRFDVPGVLGRRCPHTVDRLLAEGAALEGSAPVRAGELYRDALALDPACVRARFGLATVADRARHEGDARDELQRIVDGAAVPAAARSMAVERIGDLHLRAGDAVRAGERYRAVLEQTLSEDRRRTVELKLAVADNPPGRRALVALLVGEDGAGPNPLAALARLGEWRALAPEDGVARYLVGRQLMSARRWEHAIEELDAALSRPLSERVRAEASRLRARAACVLGRGDEARAFAERAANLDVVSTSRKGWLRAFAARCP